MDAPLPAGVGMPAGAGIGDLVRCYQPAHGKAELQFLVRLQQFPYLSDAFVRPVFRQDPRGTRQFFRGAHYFVDLLDHCFDLALYLERLPRLMGVLDGIVRSVGILGFFLGRLGDALEL